MSILLLNKLALELVARDFSGGHIPTNAGPTRTSRALAIIHLAARDAYAMVTQTYAPKLSTLPAIPLGLTKADGIAAALAAGVRAAELLYPDDDTFISNAAGFLALGRGGAIQYGNQVAELWITSRKSDSADMPQTDVLFNQAAGHHRPDPLDPKQTALGRNWGKVRPFVLTDVKTEAMLKPPHALGSKAYKCDFDEVYVCGKNSLPNQDAAFRKKAVEGIFWAYDGANKIGTPPSLYNQVVVRTGEFMALGDAEQINILAAINAAMADAGIAAWYWKYEYDRWRPVVGIREAAGSWGPTGAGDGTDNVEPDPFWLPLGAPASNTVDKQNGTPNFPAYPSGHATFGAACFKTFAKLLNKSCGDITLDFVSDEFDGTTTDNRGVTRPRYVRKNLSLTKAIEENNLSRIYLGVHWRDDAKGGETLGTLVADKCAAAFK